MRIVERSLEDILVLKTERHTDARGWFMEIYSEQALADIGIRFRAVQDNCSESLRRGTVRGLHFQVPPHAQAKLLRCTRGSVLQIAVDIRRGSPNYGKASCIRLCEDDDLLVYIPKGYAQGTAALEDGSQYTYKVDYPYMSAEAYNGGISCLYDSEQLDWEKLLPDTRLIMSDRDRNGLCRTLDELDSGFVYGE